MQSPRNAPTQLIFSVEGFLNQPLLIIVIPVMIAMAQVSFGISSKSAAASDTDKRFERVIRVGNRRVRFINLFINPTAQSDLTKAKIQRAARTESGLLHKTLAVSAA